MFGKKSKAKNVATVAAETVAATVGSATATPDPNADAVALGEAAKSIRELLRRTAATLGAIGTAVVGGVGYTQLTEIFPLPPGGDGTATAIAIALGVALASAGVVLVTREFFRAQRQVLVSTAMLADARRDSERRKSMFDVSAEEAQLAERVMNEHAHENKIRDLRMLELRAIRFDRLSRKLAADEDQKARSKAFADESKRLNDVVTIALKRTVVTILEHRSSGVSRGSLPLAIYMSITVLGIILLWGGAGYSAGERDLVDLRKNCAAAEKDGAAGACESIKQPGASTDAGPSGETGATGAIGASGPTGIAIAGLKQSDPAFASKVVLLSDCVAWLEGVGAVPEGKAAALCIRLAKDRAGSRR